MNIKEKLKWDKIKINWNKNPIKMPTFLSFLMVEVTKSNDHLGSLTGWTLYYNKNLNLEIHGGWVNDIEYLDGLEYGNKLYSKWNNFVNPFYIFDIITDEGKSFFVDYYKEDIENLIENQYKKIEQLKKELKRENTICKELCEEAKLYFQFLKEKGE